MGQNRIFITDYMRRGKLLSSSRRYGLHRRSNLFRSFTLCSTHTRLRCGASRRRTIGKSLFERRALSLLSSINHRNSNSIAAVTSVAVAAIHDEILVLHLNCWRHRHGHELQMHNGTLINSRRHSLGTTCVHTLDGVTEQ
jgi:hypothetical protein